jgi:hypothetical protein
MAYRQTINPNGNPFVGIYGAAGPDLLTSLLAMDASHVFMIDTEKVRFEKLKQLIQQQKQNPEGTVSDWAFYAKEKRYQENFWNFDHIEGHIEELIVEELISIGAFDGPDSDLKAYLDHMNNVVIEFSWAYPGESDKRSRQFTFINKPLETLDQMLPMIRQLSDRDGQKFDFYYQKSSMAWMKNSRFRRFLSQVIQASNSILIGPYYNDNKDGQEKMGRVGVFWPIKWLSKNKFKKMNVVNKAYAHYFSDYFKHPGVRYTYYLDYYTAEKGLYLNNSMGTFIQSDKAQLSDVGGIDFNPNNFSLNTQGDRIPFHTLTADQIIQSDNIDGFVPVIINVSPITNIPLLIGEVRFSEEMNLSKND